VAASAASPGARRSPAVRGERPILYVRHTVLHYEVLTFVGLSGQLRVNVVRPSCAAPAGVTSR